jgi:16S rRNA (guanine527-N7)-methyltransferase
MTSLDKATSLISYLELIIKWNKTYNLSAICTMEIGVKKHLLDCLSIMPYVDESPLLDVGAGAGLPGIVLSIMKPTLAVSVLDSVGKKCRFMQFAGNLTKTLLRFEDLKACVHHG